MNYAGCFLGLLILNAGFCLASTKQEPCGAFVLSEASPFQIEEPDSVLEKASLFVGQTGSALAVVVASPTGVAQGSRIASVSRLISCEGTGELSVEPPLWMDSPTQLALGNSELQYLSGAVVGNWLLIGGFELAHAAAARYWGADRLHFPGFGVLPVLLFVSPLTEFSLTLLRLGTGLEKAAGFASLGGCVGLAGLMGWKLWPSHFGARFKKGSWISKERGSAYVERYGALFEGYQASYYAFILTEYGMSMLLGGLQAMQMSPKISCSALTASATGILGVYWVAVTALRPSLDPKEKVFLSAVTGLETLALLLESSRSFSESAEKNEALETTAQTIPLTLSYLNFGKAGFDLGMLLWSLYRAAPKPELPMIEYGTHSSVYHRSYLKLKILIELITSIKLITLQRK